MHKLSKLLVQKIQSEDKQISTKTCKVKKTKKRSEAKFSRVGKSYIYICMFISEIYLYM